MKKQTKRKGKTLDPRTGCVGEVALRADGTVGQTENRTGRPGRTQTTRKLSGQQGGTSGITRIAHRDTLRARPTHKRNETSAENQIKSNLEE